jgi:hypothetical protein
LPLACFCFLSKVAAEKRKGLPHQFPIPFTSYPSPSIQRLFKKMSNYRYKYGLTFLPGMIKLIFFIHKPIAKQKTLTPLTYTDAIQYAENWRETKKIVFPDGQVFKAFNIPASDIVDLYKKLQEPGVSSFRAYMALGDKNDMSSIRLLLVAVDINGHDVINKNAADDSGIFDFTTPCPTQCDKDSPLNNLFL